MHASRGCHKLVSHLKGLMAETKEEIEQCHQELDKGVSDRALLAKYQKVFNESNSEILLLATKIEAITGIWQTVSLSTELCYSFSFIQSIT